MNFGNMMKQAREMQAKMAEAEKKIDALEVEGSSGGGMVRVTLNGKGVIKRVKIDPSVVAPDDVEMLEDLVVAAYNEGKKKADEESQKEMSKVTGGLKLPPGMGLPF
jgi:nucleoid-associated protein EbfC